MQRPLVLGVVVLARLAAAAEPVCDTPSTRAAIDGAARLYRSLALEQARQQLDRARAQSCGGEDEVLIDLYLGLVEYDLGHSDAAAVAFRAALLRRPDATLPESSISPKVVEQFERIRAQLRREGLTTPPPARVVPSADAVPAGSPPVQAGREAPAPPERAGVGLEGRASVRRFAWVPLAASAALLGGGIFGVVQATERHTALVGEGRPPLGTQGPSVAQAGAAFQAVGWACLVASAVSLTVGVVLFLIDAGPEVRAALSPLAGSGAVVGLGLR